MSAFGPPGPPTPSSSAGGARASSSAGGSTPTGSLSAAAAGSASGSAHSLISPPGRGSTPTPLASASARPALAPSLARTSAAGSPRWRSGSSLRPQSAAGLSSSASPPGGSRSSSAFSFAPWDFPASPAPPRALRHSRHSSLSAARATSVPPPPAAEEAPLPQTGQRAKFEETNAVSFTWVISDMALLRDEVEHSSAPGAVVDDDASLSSSSSSSLDSDAEESDGLGPISSEHDADGITRSVSAGAGRSEVWSTEPTFGDGLWKLELVRRQTVVSDSQPRQAHHDRASAIPVLVPIPGIPGASGFRPKRAHRAPRKRKTVTTLSVYLTNCAMEKPIPALKRKPATPVLHRPSGPVHAAIMVGVRPLSALSQDGGPTGVLDPAPYLHQSFHSFTFSHEAEYFACHDLPPLSKLMDHPDVRRQDAVALTINITTGAGAGVMCPPPAIAGADMNPAITGSTGPGTVLFPQPNTRYVAPSILDALGSLLDCPRSGDVCIRTRERGVAFMPIGWSARQSARLQAEMRQHGKSPTERTYSSDEPETEPADAGGDAGPGTESPGGWWTSVRPPKVPEHLVQPFPLGSAMPSPVPEAAVESVLVVRDRVIWAHSAVLKARSEYFATMLESKFAEGGDGRGVHELRIPDADYATVYWLLRYLYIEHVEFAATDEAKEACGNVDDSPALGPALGAGLVPPGQDGFLVDWTPVEALDWLSKYADAMLYDWEESLPTTPRQASDELGADQSTSALEPASSADECGWDAPATGAAPGSSAETEAEGSGSARIGIGRTADPHAHPCTANSPPASALTMYRLAHRYGEARLLAAAEQHVLAHLAPNTAFRVFLATRFFASLHAGVTRFVYDNWAAVAESREFERCCDEVSQGDWGPDAGRSLHSFMKSLLSPVRSA